MELTIDYETRSPIDLKKCGAFVYANSPYTEAMMLAVKVNDDTAKLWIPPNFEHYKESEIPTNELNYMIKHADKLIAHNAPFERWITKFTASRYGVDELPLNKIVDTAVLALRCGLPKDLDSGVKILFKGKYAKDKEGKNLINILSKPRKLLKADYEQIVEDAKSKGYNLDVKQLQELFSELMDTKWKLGEYIDPRYAEMFLKYKGDKELFCRFGEYARTDVDVEREMYKVLPKLSDDEHEMWMLDQVINDRGVRVDRPSAIEIQRTVLQYVKDLNEYGISLTNGNVTSMKSPASILTWLRRHGVEIDSVDKETIKELLESNERGYEIIRPATEEHYKDYLERTYEEAKKTNKEFGYDVTEPPIRGENFQADMEIRRPLKLEPVVKEFLEIRQQASKSSSAKYEAMKLYSSVDERCHGLFVFNGAATGRWAGAGVQPQNLPRPAGSKNLVDSKLFDTKEYYAEAEDIELMKTGDIELVKMFWKDPMVLSADLLRPMFISSEGYDFICADYSAIEARGLAYLAGEEETLQVFRDGKDVYKFAAIGIYNVPYEQIDSYQRQVGKTCVLALGYGGGYGAMLKFGADKLGINSAMGKDIVKKWREANHKIEKLWYDLVECSKIAFNNKGDVVVSDACPSVSFVCKDKVLVMILPSGRKLYYLFPKLEEVEMPWSTPEKKATKKLITALTTENRQAKRRVLNHLILTENLVQAFCNDLLRYALLNLEKNYSETYQVVMHVHDEAVAESLEGVGSVEEFERIICELPTWAEGLPIKAEGWRGKRYRK